jgi:hypothetical protein
VDRGTADVVDQNIDSAAVGRRRDQFFGGTGLGQVHGHERHLPPLFKQGQLLARGS